METHPGTRAFSRFDLYLLEFHRMCRELQYVGSGQVRARRLGE